MRTPLRRQHTLHTDQGGRTADRESSGGRLPGRHLVHRRGQDLPGMAAHRPVIGDHLQQNRRLFLRVPSQRQPPEQSRKGFSSRTGQVVTARDMCPLVLQYGVELLVGQ